MIRTIPPGPDNPLGRRWLEFATGDGWQIGLHGTPHPELLGQAVSHGCVRIRDEDVVKGYGRVRVGTVVTDARNDDALPPVVEGLAGWDAALSGG